MVREECLAKYRQCSACKVIHTNKKNRDSTVYNKAQNPANVIDGARLAKLRMIEPTSKELTAFHAIVDSVPPVLLGKTGDQVMKLRKSYGISKDKKTQNSQQLIEETLEDHSITIKGFVKRADLRTLRVMYTSSGDKVKWWLNDTIIDAFLALLRVKIIEYKVPVRVFSSKFYEKLASQDYSHIKRETLKEWKQLCLTLFHYEKVIVPINSNNAHW